MKNTLKIENDAMDILRIWSSDRTNCYALGKSKKKHIIFLKILLGSYDRNLRQCWGSGRVCSLHFSCSPGPLRRWNYLDYIIMLFRPPFHPFELISYHVYFMNMQNLHLRRYQMLPGACLGWSIWRSQCCPLPCTGRLPWKLTAKLDSTESVE